jgi:hypothetical protein
MAVVRTLDRIIWMYEDGDEILGETFLLQGIAFQTTTAITEAGGNISVQDGNGDTLITFRHDPTATFFMEFPQPITINGLKFLNANVSDDAQIHFYLA